MTVSPPDRVPLGQRQSVPSEPATSRGGVTLVTGATGFTGTHLVRSLIEDGERVRVIVRSPERARAELPPGVEIVAGDLTDPATIARAMPGVRTIYHVAAAYREAKHSESYYRAVNVEATGLLLEAARAEGVERFVHCSTVGVMSHIQAPPADETHPYAPSDVYQETKTEAERLALSFAREYGFPVTVARPTAIYGPGDTRLLKLFRMIAARRFIMLGSGDVYYHMVHVSDLVRGLRLMATHPAAPGEVFILGGEKYYRLRAIASYIARVVGAPPPRLSLPAAPFQLAGALCERICVPLGIEPPLHRRRVDFFTKSRAFSIAKAWDRLGYRPLVGLASGLRSTAEWYQKHGLLGTLAVVLA